MQSIATSLTTIGAYVERYPVAFLLGPGYLAVATAIVLETPVPAVARLLVGLPLVVFVPGYAVVTALFPENRGNPVENSLLQNPLTGTDRGGITVVERIALSVCLSISIVPVAAVGLDLLGLRIATRPVLAVLVAVSAVGLVLGVSRRERLAPGRRYDPSVLAWAHRTRHALFRNSGPVRATLNVALLLSVLLLAAVSGFALSTAGSGTPNTELMLLTETETGSYVADGFQQSLSANGSAEVVVGVRNDEGERVDYSVVVLSQRVGSNDTSVSVRSSRELRRLGNSVPANETWYASPTVRPEATGERTRLTYLLYRGSAPPEPSIDSSYRHAYVYLTPENA